MSRRIKLAAASLAVGAGMTAAAAQAAPKLELVERPADRFATSIETHKAEVRYRDALAEAADLGVAPSRDLFDRPDTSRSELRRASETLDERIERARAAERAESTASAAAGQSDYGLAAGVSPETLEAIAACESGGDPTAVDASGTYYGKYQFDLGTWASVGGSGSPAEASEAEQDYRASLLYSQAGSSPWPVCAA